MSLISSDNIARTDIRLTFSTIQNSASENEEPSKVRAIGDGNDQVGFWIFYSASWFAAVSASALMRPAVRLEHSTNYVVILPEDGP
jgi:hypothetical protein